tara:strand:+ start:335 stop:1015 length:681 start_codon:yes stop_codon:yes gene_type:complete
MGEGFPFLDIVLFAMVAAFIILRLRGVLGRRPGNGRPNYDALSRRQQGDENVITLPDRAQDSPEESDQEYEAEEEAVVGAGLRDIRAADNQFSPDEFLQGARAAYEMIVTAYAVADDAVLQQLLSDEVYENFAGAIQERISMGHTLETTLLAIRSADIVEARLAGDTAEVTVKFVSDVINVTREEDGTVVSGDPDMAQDVTDFWTFARNARSSDPNWQLVETRSPQ